MFLNCIGDLKLKRRKLKTTKEKNMMNVIQNDSAVWTLHLCPNMHLVLMEKAYN